MYQADSVDVVYLALPPASITALNAEPEEYVEGTFSLAETDGTPDGIATPSAPITVGIRLKGQFGSKRSLAQKAAFKVKFNWVKGQKFLGLKKLTLNNMVQDPSSIHEALSYRAFRSAGVDASRTAYAYVYVNGTDYGLHLNLENVDDVAVEKRFGSFQHVYEGSYGADVETGSAPSAEEIAAAAGAFEVDEGDEDELGDLEALIAAVNGSAGGDWSERVDAVADLKQMTRMWAVERYAGHWDGYAGQESDYQPNNYYFHSDGEGWFRMLPWGVDQTWQDHLEFDGDAGVLFDRCLDDDSCAEMYQRSLREAGEAIDAAELDEMAAELGALVRPWVEKEQANSRHEHSVDEFEDEVQGTGDFLASRPAELASWLQSQPPAPPATQISLSLDPTAIVADGIAGTTATAVIADADDDPVPGDELVFSSSDPGQQLGPVVDNDDGTYSVEIRSSTRLGTATITATDRSPSPDLAATADLTQVIGPAANVALSLQPAALPADGAATTIAMATVTDAGGHPIVGGSVGFSSTDPGQRLGAVTVHGDGRYSVQLASSTRAGAATITATDGATGVSGMAVLTQTSTVGGAEETRAPDETRGSPTIEPDPLPNVILLGKPRHRTHDRSPSFRFAASPSTVTFSCKLDSRPYRACASPLTLPKLSWGAHTFRVRALTAAGAPGPAVTHALTITPRRRY